MLRFERQLAVMLFVLDGVYLLGRFSSSMALQLNCSQAKFDVRVAVQTRSRASTDSWNWAALCL